MYKFKANAFGGTNQIMKIDEDVYVSYNPSPHKGLAFFEADEEGQTEGETALIVEGEFFILNGDFRDEYTKAANEDPANIAEVFNSNRDRISTWSNEVNPLEFFANDLRICRNSLPSSFQT